MTNPIIITIVFCFRLLADKGFSLQARGKVVIKGKGQMKTWFLTGSHDKDIHHDDVSNDSNESSNSNRISDGLNLENGHTLQTQTHPNQTNDSAVCTLL